VPLTTGWRRAGRPVLAGALAFAAVGGGVAGFTQGGPWPGLGGLMGGMAALLAGIVADRVFQRRDEFAAARARRGDVLDRLVTEVTRAGNDVLGLLVPTRCATPFRGRTREQDSLAAWCDSADPPVMIVSGPAGVGKTRLAMQVALRLPSTWAAGWLHPGAGAVAISAVRACGDPAVILVGDADGRADIVPLLDDLAERHDDLRVRVVLIARSAGGLKAWLATRLDERHRWVADRAIELPLGPHGGEEDRQRWFAEAVTEFAKILHERRPDLAGCSPASGVDISQPILMLQAQALLAVLGHAARGGKEDPRSLTASQICAALMEHEQRRWRDNAALADWGSGAPPAQRLQERCVAALALLGAADVAEATAVLRRIPELRDASGERLSDIATWAARLYPSAGGFTPAIRPSLVGEWFVVTQLARDADFSRALSGALTVAQAARALSLLGHAADHFASAADLFAEFVSGDVERLVLAAVVAARAGETGQRLLDPVVAGRVRAAEWTIGDIKELLPQIPPYLLLTTRVALLEIAVALFRQLAEDNPAVHQPDFARVLGNHAAALDRVGEHRRALDAAEEAATLYRQLTKDNPTVHQPNLAHVLDNLGVRLDRTGDKDASLAAYRESVEIYRDLARLDPGLYKVLYEEKLAKLRREYDREGLRADALRHHLIRPPTTPPSP
jgi:tetratricopeptide (TPR) repeat protein